MSLSSTVNTFDRGWCEFIARDGWFIFRNWDKNFDVKLLVWQFRWSSFLAVQYPQMKGCLSTLLGVILATKPSSSGHLFLSEDNVPFCPLLNIVRRVCCFSFPYYPAKSGILQSPLCVCLFVSRIPHKLLVVFWWNLVSREVMIIGRPSSKLGVIRIEIRIWDPDNCFSWTTGRIYGSGFQSDPG